MLSRQDFRNSYQLVSDADEAGVLGAVLLLFSLVIEAAAVRGEAGVNPAEQSVFVDLVRALKVGSERDLALVLQAKA